MQVFLLAALAFSALYRACVTHPLGVDGYLLYAPGIAFAPLVLGQLSLAVLHQSKLSLLSSLLSLTILLGPLMGFHWSLLSTPGKDTLTLVSLNADSWHTDLKKVASMIRAEGPDLIALQEIWSAEHLKIFQDAFPDYQFAGPTGGSNFGGGNFLGVRTGADFTIASHEATYEAAGAILHYKKRPFLVLSIHSPRSHSFGPHGLRETIREQTEQARAILNLIDKAKIPSIIIGDFNSPPTGPSQKLLKARFHSAFDETGRGFGHTFPARIPLIRIEHAWGSSEIKFYETREVDLGSDHLGLVVKLSLSSVELDRPEERSAKEARQMDSHRTTD